MANSAGTSSRSEKLGSKPGASRATLAAGLAGLPVIMANQMTQITAAQPVKNSKANQSISAETLRLSVGSAKAARQARPGRAASKARSLPFCKVLDTTGAITDHSGKATWGLRRCRRQRHKVHKASGHAGQVNQASRRARLRQSAHPSGGPQ